MLKTIVFNGVRVWPRVFKCNLYSPAALGVENYLSIRSKVQEQFGDNAPKFKEQLMQMFENKPDNMVFTEDLKNIIHLAKYDQDIDSVVKLIKKFNSQNKEIRLGNFVFGPVVFRLFYCAKNIDAALKDPELERFFDQVISCQILLDMLYENRRYEDMLDVYNIIKERQLTSVQHSKHIIVLIFAGLFKLNTPESLEQGMKLWNELNNKGNVLMRKATTFLAGLALRQNSPHVSIEVLSATRDQQYLTVRNIKVQAFAELGRIEDAIMILKSVLHNDSYSNKKQTFLKETVLKVKQSIELNGKKEHEAEFNRIEKSFLDNDYLTDMSLDDILCSEILTIPNIPPRQNRNLVAPSFSRNRNNNRTSNYADRPGLNELQ